MSPVLQIVLALGSVLVLLGLMALVRHLAGIWNIRAEVQRKLVHIGTGLYAIGLPWLFPDRWPVYFLVFLTLIVMMFLRLPNSRLGGTLHSVERQSYGDLLLAVSVGVCLFLSGDTLFLYVLPIAVLTLSDAAAALAGSTYGTRFFQVEDGEKSVEGSAVFFGVTLLISIICLMLMSPFPPINIIVLSVMVAAFGTLVEADSWRGFDNVFLPVGLLIFLGIHAADPLQDLLALAAIFAICIVAFKLVSAKLGLSHHAARVYVTAIFLLLAVTEAQNAVFPILVLAAHAWCRSAVPCSSRYPDLDVVAGVALVSFGWLTLGIATGWNALSFYGLTTIGMMVSFCAIALANEAVFFRSIGLAGILAATYVLRGILVSLNPQIAKWPEPMEMTVLACLGVAALVPALATTWFAQARALKVTMIALVIPLFCYFYAIAL